VGYTLLAAELLVLEAAARNRRWLWLLPPLFAVWVNCHGSNFFGMAVLIAYWACSFVSGKWGLITATAAPAGSRRMLGIIVVLCGLALLCNPVGVQQLLYPLNTAFQMTTSMMNNEEWQPTDPSSLRGAAMIAGVMALFAVPLLRRSELRLLDIVLVAMGFGLALRHVRMLFVFGILFGPAISRVLGPLWKREDRREHPILNAILLAVFGAAMLAAFPSSAEIQKQIRKQNPAAAVEFIRRSGISGPMLNEYVFGDYLIWAFPESKVFVDGRGDIYDWTGVLAEYGRFVTVTQDPNILLDKYKIRYCLLHKDTRMVNVLPHLEGWKQVYADDVATVFLRD